MKRHRHVGSGNPEHFDLRLKPLTLACAVALGIGSSLALAQPTEEVIVTGTRVQTTGMQTPTPVTQVTAAELDAAAPGTLIEGISQLPQFFDNQTPNSPGSWFTRGGYGNLNLRGLGINRTLTLLDGRRMISSTPFGDVDINVFPEAMVERVETVTGGASAAYGTDAAGVVNFVLDTDFDGLELSLQTGATAESDGDADEFSVAYGRDIGQRGHLLVSAERYEQDGVFSYAGRDWYQAWGTIPGPGGTLLIRPQVITTGASRDGLIFAPGSSLNGMAFDRDGNLVPFEVGDPAWTPAPFQVGVPPAATRSPTAAAATIWAAAKLPF
jgi:iron complex outermembrane receptor protein